MSDPSSVAPDVHETDVLVVGAGPAGLACAQVLAEAGLSVEMVERNAEPGGLARSVEIDGQIFDLGNHKLPAYDPDVRALVASLFGRELPCASPMSALAWRDSSWSYPVSPRELLSGLPAAELARISGSLLAALPGYAKPTRNYGDVVRRRYGNRLYATLFAPYLRKVWGLDPTEMAEETRSDRADSIWRSFRLRRGEALRGDKVFLFPDGLGGLYRRWGALVEERGVRLHTSANLISLRHENGRVHLAEVETADGGRRLIRPRHVVSTIPAPALLKALAPRLAAMPDRDSVRFRNVRLVNMVLDQDNPFPHDCLYVADPDLPFVRIANFTNQYGNAERRPGSSALGFELWADPGDAIWAASDSDLVDMTLDHLGGIIPRPRAVLSSRVMSLPFAAPVRTAEFNRLQAGMLGQIRSLTNLHVAGRAASIAAFDQDDAMRQGWAVGRSIAGLGGVSEARAA